MPAVTRRADWVCTASRGRRPLAGALPCMLWPTARRTAGWYGDGREDFSETEAFTLQAPDQMGDYLWTVLFLARRSAGSAAAKDLHGSRVELPPFMRKALIAV